MNTTAKVKFMALSGTHYWLTLKEIGEIDLHDSAPTVIIEDSNSTYLDSDSLLAYWGTDFRRYSSLDALMADIGWCIVEFESVEYGKEYEV